MQSGYHPSLENLDELFAGSQQYECVYGDAGPPTLPHPREWMQVESQANRPACVGHGLSTLVEYVQYLATNGKTIEQLNRMFGWVMSQKMGGQRPSESSGASINGAAKVACELGLPPEDVYPYSNSFRSEFPPEVYEEAKKRRCLYKYELNTVEQVKNFHDNHMGGVLWGCLWRFQRNAWHCVASIGDTVDGKLSTVNSWGLKDGEKGWWYWDDETISRHLGTSGAVAIGISDLAEPQIRGWDASRGGFA